MGAALREDKYSEAAVRIELGASRIALAAIASMSAATLALIACTPGPVGLRILAATWIACAALRALHVVALARGRRAVRAFQVWRGGEIEVRDAHGAWASGALRAGSFVSPWLTIVRWRAERELFDRSIVILPDMLAAGDFRRVRVWLRWS